MAIKAIRKYSDNLTIEIEAEDQAKLFQLLASCDDVWMDMTAVAKVNGEWKTSDRVKHNVRTTAGGDEYFEILCYDNQPMGGFKKKISQNKGEKKGQLYHKRQAEQNEIEGARGWVKYVNPDGVAM